MRPPRLGDPLRVGHYDVEGVLGSGGMGTVYLGRSPGGRPAAVKVINRDYLSHPDALARFRREADTLATIRSAYTTTLIACSLRHPPYWMATEYIPGPTLADSVAARGPVAALEGVRLMAALAEGLADIHAHGICHRDLKPSNVILSATGPHLIDFGIARAVDQTGLTASGVFMGTPGYLAPEQVESDVLTPASDVFALGATVAHAVTGRRPFGQGTLERVYLRLLQGDIDLDGVEPGLAGLIRACVTREPSHRPSPAQLIVGCRTWMDDHPPAPAPPPPSATGRFSPPGGSSPRSSSPSSSSPRGPSPSGPRQPFVSQALPARPFSATPLEPPQSPAPGSGTRRLVVIAVVVAAAVVLFAGGALAALNL
jgi:serine/threonine protein kinase